MNARLLGACPLLLAVACSFPEYSFQSSSASHTTLTCADGAIGPEETGVDCGGLCPACPAGQPCVEATDCESGHCEGDVCQSPSCKDGVLNGSESAVDCGGPCDPCADGKTCHDDGDCTSRSCDQRLCQAATCNDGRKNGSETDKDCGGPCPQCQLGDGCISSRDCQSDACDANQSVCIGPGCSDQLRNGDETDVDCGGTKCAACDAGKGCSIANDCTSLICDAKTGSCVAASCTDAVQNQGETDLDCGGASCAPCDLGKHCLTASDCASELCQSEECLPTTPTKAPLARNGWQVSAPSDTFYNPPTVAIDGDASTRWSSGVNQYTGMWYSVDLGEQQYFFSIVIDSKYDSSDHAQQLNVYFSNTTDFGQPARSGIVGSDITTIAFDTPVVARYIKLELATGYTKWWSIDELNVLQ
ncbi:MAG TPA: discoidin domain-containing protein [Polyangiaceae bacterium]|nr:discoidin domain-containing protein [Polyangiaceae bacterium]